MSNLPEDNFEIVETTFVSEPDDQEEYIPMEVGDTIKIELSLPFTTPFSPNNTSYWVKVGNEVSVLPGESADEAADRAQEIALGTLFNTADRYRAILTQRTRNTIKKNI